jgi:HrpA-like RNA helicase
MGYNETKIIYASENTLKQRKGRLGRTTDGVYIQLYDDK